MVYGVGKDSQWTSPIPSKLIHDAFVSTRTMTLGFMLVITMLQTNLQIYYHLFRIVPVAWN